MSEAVWVCLKTTSAVKEDVWVVLMSASATNDPVLVARMTASVVIGSSIVMTVPGGPTLFGAPALVLLGLLGYVLAFMNSVWIIYGIWRSSKR